VQLIQNKSVLNGLEIGKTPKQKQEIFDYFFSPSEKLENGNSVSKWVKDINDYQKKPEWVLFQGLVLKNKLDFEKAISSQTESAATTRVRKSLQDILEKKKSSSISASENVAAGGPKSNPMGIDFNNLQNSVMS
jgi:hypothetical protein